MNPNKMANLMNLAACLIFAAVATSSKSATSPAGLSSPAVMRNGFISDSPPFPASHASTVVETRKGIMAAWFGGTQERHPDVSIYTARFDGRQWSPPVQVVNGIQADGQKRYPCWNPVLFQPKSGPLLLFYKVGPSPSTWWGMLMTSDDDGQTWSAPRRLPEGQVGPVRNKPVQWPDGSLLCPASSEDNGWRIHMERTPDLGLSWERTPTLNDGKAFPAIQPTILRWASNKVQILNRTKQGVISECWMGDSWKTWSPMKPTLLPNPNSAIDAVMLRDGRALLVYNHSPSRRSPLNVGLSKDGVAWQNALELENTPGEFCYPAVIQASDGLVHITYTWKRERIRHVILDPGKLL